MENKKAKSEWLIEEDKKALKNFLKLFLTKMEAAETIGITKPTLNRILAKKRGSPHSIDKIKQAIKQFSKTN